MEVLTVRKRNTMMWSPRWDGHAVPESDSWMAVLSGRVQKIDGCWVVDGDRDTYARLWDVATGSPQLVHRMVFRVFNPDTDITDMHIHHTCRTPGCIKPNHLVALTPAEHRAVHAAA